MKQSTTTPEVRRARVLVIDDDPVTLMAVKRVLTDRAEMDVVTCTGPADGLTLLADDTFDVVVTDVQMPEMTGLQLLDHLRTVHPGLPVVVYTAATSVDSTVDVIRSEADGFLFKPLDPAKLVRTVRGLVRPPAEPARPSRLAWLRRG